jgi:hypothetical protein
MADAGERRNNWTCQRQPQYLDRRHPIMRTYYRSFSFWLGKVVGLLLILFVVCAAPLSEKQPVIGKISGMVFGGLLLWFLYLICKTEPYAIKIFPDRFEVCRVLRRKIYRFENVTGICLDFVRVGSGRTSDVLQIVRIDFQTGRHLELSSLPNRRKLYEDMCSCRRLYGNIKR